MADELPGSRSFLEEARRACDQELAVLDSLRLKSRAYVTTSAGAVTVAVAILALKQPGALPATMAGIAVVLFALVAVSAAALDLSQTLDAGPSLETLRTHVLSGEFTSEALDYWQAVELQEKSVPNNHKLLKRPLLLANIQMCLFAFQVLFGASALLASLA